MPAMTSVLSPVPHPDPSTDDFDLEFATGGVAESHPLPCILWLLCEPFIDADALTFCLKQLGLPAPPAVGNRDGGGGIVEIDHLILVNVGDEDLALTIQRPKEPWLLAVVLQWHFLNPGNLSLDMAPASDGLVPSPPV